MDDAQAALLYRSDLRGILQGLIAVLVIFGLYLRHESKRASKNADLFRRSTRRYRSARRALRSKKSQLEVMANRLSKANMIIAELQIEARRLLAIRAKTERGCLTKDGELQAEREKLQAALELVRRLRLAPTLTSEL